jgi:hypothetical protein
VTERLPTPNRQLPRRWKLGTGSRGLISARDDGIVVWARFGWRD